MFSNLLVLAMSAAPQASTPPPPAYDQAAYRRCVDSLQARAAREGIGSALFDRHVRTVVPDTSVLRLLVEFGQLDSYDWSALRLVLFAGEVFPVKHLRSLLEAWPSPRYFNLYGPTETNVCTYHEIPSRIPVEREDPFPIGRVCENDEGMVVDERDRPVEVGEEGELLILGGTVMQG